MYNVTYNIVLTFKGRYDMDTFFEQIVAIKKSGKSIAAVTGIWLLTIILTAILLLFKIPVVSSFALFLICGIIFGAYKLTCLFNIEYEYIITNGTFDVDKIINKSSRKRILSFDLSNVSRLEKFNAGMLNSLNQKEITFACNANDEEAYLLVAERDGKKPYYLIFAPEERLKGAIVKFVPKYISNSAFK